MWIRYVEKCFAVLKNECFREYRINSSCQSANLDNTNVHTNRTRLKAKLSVFKEEAREKPLRYLNDMNDYVRIMGLDDHQALYQIEQSLEGVAGVSYDVTERTIASFGEFETRFRERFWSEAIRDEWVREVKYLNFDPTQKYTRLDHATHIWGFSKELNNKFTEEEQQIH